MSRVGQVPIDLPEGVTVTVTGDQVTVKGRQGELHHRIPPELEVTVQDRRVLVTRRQDDARARALHGTTRRLLANMIQGVRVGFSKELEIQGVGFRAQVQGRKLVLSLGFSHPVEYEAPEGVQLRLGEGNVLTVSGADKQKVGDVAARIRSFFPAEPYKGKGIRYRGEHVRRKAGKTVA